MKIEVKTDGLAMNHISFVVENHDSQELVGSPAKELEGPEARTELDFLSLHSELESEPKAVNIVPIPESREDVSMSGAHRNPAQFSAEPLREADTYFPRNPTPCSLMTAFLDIWR